MFRYGVDSEYGQLKAVLLSKPHPDIGNVANPKKILHLKKVNYAIMKREFEQITKLNKKFKLKIVFLDLPGTMKKGQKSIFNLFFNRDHFLMIPRGIIIGRMFSDIRRGEIKYVEKAVEKAGIRIRKVIRPSGTFEGADALWVNHKLVIVGVGKRTNMEGFRQVKEELAKDSIKCISVPAPRNVIHLLGALQFIDLNTALVRGNLVSLKIIKLLRENKIKVIKLSENSEIKNKQAMNFVTIAPRTIIMPAGCPKTKKIFEKLRIKIAAEIPASQYIRAGGGISCATGILARA